MNWKSLVQQKWFYSPALAPWQIEAISEMKAQVPSEENLLWILSSGTQSVRTVKAIGLSESAILCSAESVNHHLQSHRADRWLVAIPHYHIGGLSIFARAHLSGAAVFIFAEKWSAGGFVEALHAHQITLTSLVPTQIHDLVSAGLQPPESLRAIVVGGGMLDSWLYARARALGWNLLPSYGLTECSSQVATAGLMTLASDAYPALQILEHVQVELRQQTVFLRSKALCQSVATWCNGEFDLCDPLADGWLATEDLATLDKDGLHVGGRRDSVVKILGILVPLLEVEFEATEVFRLNGWNESFALLPLPDARRGSRILLVTDSGASVYDWQTQIEKYNSRVAGVRRLQGPCWVPQIPRSDLGKVKRAELSAEILG